MPNDLKIATAQFENDSDDNVIENVRVTALLGAEIIFMPHVTMCTPSTRPVLGSSTPFYGRTATAIPPRCVRSSTASSSEAG